MEDHPTRLAWICLLAMADKHGRVFGSIPGLANRARVTLLEMEGALEKFLSPDTYSRTKDFGGRRIEVMDGGWKLLNHGKYRAIRDEEARREYKKEWMRESRKAKKQGITIPDVDNLSGQNGLSSNFVVTNGHNAESRKQKADALKPPISPKGFDVWYDAYPKKVARGAAERAWRNVFQPFESLPKMLAALERQKASEQWRKDGGQFIPNPATWLNQRRWEDGFESLDYQPRRAAPPQETV